MAYATVTLTGTYQTPDGTPHKGHVEIIPSERVIKDTTGDIILTGRVKVDLDAQGAFSVALPATDDETLNPTGFGYTIAAKLHSSHPPAVSFSLPAALGATTVEDLTPVDPATFAPTTTYAEKSELDAVAATIPTTAADVNALPDSTVIPSTPGDINAEPAGLSTTTQNTLANTYVGQAQRPDPFRTGFMSLSKGGRIGTNGRTPVALRFDDWQDNIISLGLFNDMKSRGLFGSIALCSELGSQNWNQVVTWDQLRTWNRKYGMEVWSHGTDHVTPYDPDPATFSANLHREIVESKEQIEAQNIRCMGWAMPGVELQPDGTTPGYESYLLTPADWTDTEAGRLLTANYALVETDMSGEFRIVPSELRYGLAHITVSDGETLTRAKNFLDAAIALGQGIEFMCHAGNLGLPGNMTYAEWLQFLDYIVAKRDAGQVEVVTPSSLPYCDPGYTRRRNLLANNNFTLPTQNAFVHDGTWYNIDGTIRQIATVADGPDGGTENVLRVSGSGFAQQRARGLMGNGGAGQTYVLDFWARGVSAATSFRFYAQADVASVFDFSDPDEPVGTTWTHKRYAFACPPDLDKLNIGIGYGYNATSPLELARVNCYVA